MQQSQVPGKKVEIRHRRSHLHKSADTRRLDTTLGAFSLGLLENPLEATIRAEAPKKAGSGQYLVPLRLTIPYSSITLIPEGQQEHGRLLLIVNIPKPKGKDHSMLQLKIPVRVPKSEVDGGDRSEKVHLDLPIPEGSHRIGIAIWDLMASVASYEILEVRAGIGDETTN